jgi:hypothetical protein
MKELTGSRDEWTLQILLASFEEANRYLRDTSRRIETHTRFYITLTTALVGGVGFLFITGVSSMFMGALLVLGAFALYGLGVITYLRFITIKVQATQHTAWQKASWYRMAVVVSGGSNGVRKPKILKPPSGPFSKQVVLILAMFCLFNSLVLSVGVFALVNTLLAAAPHRAFHSVASWVLVYGIPVALAFGLSSALLLRQLKTEVRRAFANYEAHLMDAFMPLV